MRNKCVKFVWDAYHESVVLQMISHKPVTYSWTNVVVYEPYFVTVGRIEQLEQTGGILFMGYFSKSYWDHLIYDPHFSDFKELNKYEFSCKGNLLDLMYALQKSAIVVHSTHHPGWFKRLFRKLFCKK